jgi:hypothetical protein
MWFFHISDSTLEFEYQHRPSMYGRLITLRLCSVKRSSPYMKVESPLLSSHLNPKLQPLKSKLQPGETPTVQIYNLETKLLAFKRVHRLLIWIFQCSYACYCHCYSIHILSNRQSYMIKIISTKMTNN